MPMKFMLGYLPLVNSEAATPRIRVLIVDDSAFMRAALSRIVASDLDLWVVGTAASGAEALQKG
jgi:two-component system, chemotaxis family, protein-glutamate methylesterase/glutaminase